MADIAERLFQYALRRGEQEARRQIDRGFNELTGRNSSRRVDSAGEQQLLSDANLFSRNGTGAIATIANRELQALGVSGAQRQQILAQLAQDPSLRAKAQELQYQDVNTDKARELIREIQNKTASLYSTVSVNPDIPSSSPGSNVRSRNTPPVAPGVFDRVQPQFPTLNSPSVTGNSPTVTSNQQPTPQVINEFIPRRDLGRFFSKLDTYAGRNGEAGRTRDLRDGVRAARSQALNRSENVSVQELGNIVPQQLVDQARTSLGFRIRTTLGAQQLSNIPDTVLSAGNAQLPAGSPVSPATILRQIDAGAERLARLAPSGGSPAGQTIKVLSVFYGLAATRLLATHGANEGTQARIDRMLQAAVTATAQIQSYRASADMTGGDSTLAQTVTPTAEPVALAPQSTAATPEINSRSQDSVIPAQPVAVVPESTSETIAGTTSTTSPQVREVSTEGGGAYQQLAQEIQQGNFDRARTYISSIAEQANVSPDEVLEIMRTKVNGGREGSELLRAISVGQLAGSLAAIIHPGGAATETGAVQVAALRAFRYGGAEGTLLSARANNRSEVVAQALTAPELPQAPTAVAAVPAFETNVVPAEPSNGSQTERRRREEEDSTLRERGNPLPNSSGTGLDNLPASVRRRVVQA